MTAKEGVKYLLEKCASEEPVFILRGRDMLAYRTILFWSELAEKAGVSEEKVCNSIAVAWDFHLWANKRLPD